MESETKLAQLRALAAQRGAAAILLRQVANFAWVTGGGRSYIPVTAELGAACVVVTADRTVVLANNIESDRLREEEMVGLNWETVSFPWWQDSGFVTCISDLVPQGTILSDWAYPGSVNISSDIVDLRTRLGAEELERARLLGHDTANALEDVVVSLTPGGTEYEVAGDVARACMYRGIQPVVVLVAADDRVFARRHPLPTGNRIRQYVLVALCGMRGGLVVSVTRLWHRKPATADIQRRWRAAAQVDAEMIAATWAGATSAEVLKVAQAEYAAAGFPDEWQNHHQGGLAGYASRESRATPTSTQPFVLGQMVAWNPSVAGAKSEDTILVPKQGQTPEIITDTGNWPTQSFETKSGMIVERPTILEREAPFR